MNIWDTLVYVRRDLVDVVRLILRDINLQPATSIDHARKMTLYRMSLEKQ